MQSRALLVTIVAFSALRLATRAAASHAAAELSGALTGPVFGHIDPHLTGPRRHAYERTLADVALMMAAEAFAAAQ